MTLESILDRLVCPNVYVKNILVPTIINGRLKSTFSKYMVRLYIFHGKSGSGKTYLINYIRNHYGLINLELTGNMETDLQRYKDCCVASPIRIVYIEHPNLDLKYLENFRETVSGCQTNDGYKVDLIIECQSEHQFLPINGIIKVSFDRDWDTLYDGTIGALEKFEFE